MKKAANAAPLAELATLVGTEGKSILMGIKAEWMLHFMNGAKLFKLQVSFVIQKSAGRKRLTADSC